LWHAIILFRQLAEGFRSADLRHHVAALSGRDLNAISQGAMTYQLRRLRLHGLIERLPNSFRYRVTDFGFRAALFFTRLYNCLLRQALPPRFRPSAPQTAHSSGHSIVSMPRSMSRSARPTRRLKLDTFGPSVLTQAGLAAKLPFRFVPKTATR
jgi:hypothetical protein